MGTPAVFWDRDNTLIADPGYLDDPGSVTLLPGAASALRRLAEAGFENICVTNQSGIARGLLTEETLVRIHERMQELFTAAGARLDAVYYCPHLPGPEAVVPEYRRDSDLRKPKPGMLLKASLERNIDLAASWSIGDSPRDAEAGRAAGCRTILIRGAGTGADSPQEPADRKNAVDFVAESIDQAVDIVIRHSRPRSRPSPIESAPAVGADPAVAVLNDILAFLRMIDRRTKTDDFSLARLAGTVVQIAALAAFLWAVFGWFFSVSESMGAHLARLLTALFLQMLAMTFFLLAGRK